MRLTFLAHNIGLSVIQLTTVFQKQWHKAIPNTLELKNLEKWYRCPYLQSGNRDPVENKLWITRGAGGWEGLGDWDSHAYTVDTWYITGHWASLVGQWQGTCLQCRRPGFSPWVGKIPWRPEWVPAPVFSLENPTQRRVAGYSPRGRRVGHD